MRVPSRQHLQLHLPLDAHRDALRNTLFSGNMCSNAYIYQDPNVFSHAFTLADARAFALADGYAFAPADSIALPEHESQQNGDDLHTHTKANTNSGTAVP